jgi:hypothetical protein
VVYHACLPARERKAPDEFLLSTLFGSAFDAGDVEAAPTFVDEVEGTDRSKGKLDVPDLELSLWHVTDAGQQVALREIVTRLTQLI